MATRARPSRRALQAGYTLLELLIVLAIVGAMAALAAPPFLQMIDQQRRLSDQASVEQILAHLAVETKAAGRDRVLRPAGASTTALTPNPAASLFGKPEVIALTDLLPEGWTASPRQDIWFRFDGVCMGGIVDVREPEGRRHTYRLTPPLCRPRIEPETRT